MENLSQKMIAILMIVIIIIIMVACGKKPKDFKPGDICIIEDGEGKFGAVKILVISESEAHVKIYKNKFDSRPTMVDISNLNLGKIGDVDGFGIGHVPLERSGFDNWKPVVVGFEEVSKDDLEGYELWKNR